MKFTVDAKELHKAIESIQIKGKNLTSKGFTSGSLGEYVYLFNEGNALSIVNGSAIFLARINLTVEAENNGECVVDASVILPYLKTFSDSITFELTDFITISQTNKKATLPRVVNHPAMDAISALLDRTKTINWSPLINNLPSFGKNNYEGAFTLLSDNFKDCMKSCELVKSGLYLLDFDKERVKLSSRSNTQNRYEEEITPNQVFGEAATLEYTGPLHNFFEKGALLNFYVKDDFPLMIVGTDRMIVKAPQTGE